MQSERRRGDVLPDRSPFRRVDVHRPVCSGGRARHHDVPELAVLVQETAGIRRQVSWNTLNVFKDWVSKSSSPRELAEPPPPARRYGMRFSFPAIGRKKLTAAVMSPFGVRTPAELAEGRRHANQPAAIERGRGHEADFLSRSSALPGRPLEGRHLRFPDYRCSPSPAFNREKFTNAPERGSQFESPLLHQVVRANRRDFPRRRIARHFSSLPRQGPVSVGVWRFSGAILDVSCRKSLAANFRFQGCCLPHVHRARFRMAVGGLNLDT
jgi:hypothetical protein